MTAAGVTAAAARPTFRVANLPAAAATVGLAGLPVLITVSRGGQDLSVGLVLLALGVGSSVGWAADDPADAVLASTPVSSPIRLAMRTAAVASVAALTAAGVLAAAALGPGLPSDLSERIPEALAAATVAMAVALGSFRRGERSGGINGVIAALVSTGLLAALSVRWPSVFPTFMTTDTHSRWWLLAIAGAVATVRLARDPADA